MVDKPEEDTTILSDVKDEFFSSPETTPKKKKKRSSVETPMDEILPVDNSPATSEQSGQRQREMTSPIHVITTHNFDMTGKPITQIVSIPEDKMIRDELIPAKHHQKDIRSFFSNSEAGGGRLTSPPVSPAGKSDSSVEVMEDLKPRRAVVEVDLTENKRGPGRPTRANNSEMLDILQQEKKKALSPRKKLPRDAKNTASKEVAKPATENLGKRKRTEIVEETKKADSAPVRKSARNEATTEVKKKEEESQAQKAQKAQKTLKTPKKEEAVPVVSPVKSEPGEKVSPSKLPTYTTMIKSALEEMNCDGGEGCTKLEILLYILRKFRPKGNVEQITSKLIKVLEVGTKRGDFLSSVSCPRVIKKDSQEATGTKATVKVEKAERGEKPKKKIVSTKLKSKESKAGEVKRGRPALVSSSKDKKESSKKSKAKVKDLGKGKTKEKKVINYTPKKLVEPLSTICKVKKGTRYEVLRKVWAYIRLKKLQSADDKKIIVCDENLKKLTKCKKFNQNALMGYLKPFMKPL